VKAKLAPRDDLGQRGGRPRRLTGALAPIHLSTRTSVRQYDGWRATGWASAN
jgi:hypothetical protein